MTKAPTDDKLDTWLEANKITSTQRLRDHLLQTMQNLRSGLVTEADADRESRYAQAAVRRLNRQLMSSGAGKTVASNTASTAPTTAPPPLGTK